MLNKILIRPLIVALAFALCGAPEALAQIQQSQTPATSAPQTSTSQDAAQQQQTWPTQDSTTPAAPAPNAAAPTAPADNAQQPSTASPDTSQPKTAPRVVLGPDGQPQPAQQNRGTTIDPSAAPLTPPTAPQSAPASTTEDQAQPPSSPKPQTEMTQKPTPQPPAPEPLGTAAAEGVRTSGNGASKPAGAAIAPAKQHRKRSLLIKLGAVAAVGVAVGTVAGLSRKTPGNPPNTTASASTR
jgi:hypothetical protein